MEIIFDKEKLTFLLKIPTWPNIPENILSYSKEQGMELKKELHISLVSFSHAKLIKNKLYKLNQFEQNTILKKLNSLPKNIDSEIIYTNEYFHIQKDFNQKDGSTEHRETIINKVLASNIKEYIELIEQCVGIKLPNLFLHITLFSKSSNPENMLSGIGIHSNEDFLSLNPKAI